MNDALQDKKMSEGFALKRHALLSGQECQEIHAGSCRLLEEVGVEVTLKEAVDYFQRGGAVYSEGRIKISREMIEKAVQQTAKTIFLGAKNPENAIHIETDKPTVFLGTGGQALYVLHYEDGGYRKKPAESRDLIAILRLCEHLDNVDFITRPVEPDVPDEEMDLTKTRIFMANTTKHMNLANLIFAERLPEIIQTVQDKSQISFISCVLVSPLRLAGSTLEKFIRIVEMDIPVSISSCPQAGLTAPLSEVGELIQVNAEVLSAVVLANLVRPGAKVLYRGIPITSNLHLDVSPRWCQPDAIRRIALVSDMTHYYGIPCCGTAAVSDEKEPNPQTVAEKTLSYAVEMASGAQFINSALGMLEQVMTVCPEQYIIDDLVIKRIKKLFSESPQYDLKVLACSAVKETLKGFGIQMSSQMEDDISNRMDFILSGMEDYSPENMTANVDLIAQAIESGKSSSKFMKTSRRGLRKGWLFCGQSFEGQLDLTEVHHLKNEILE